MEGISSFTELKFFLKPNPAFTINGMLNNVIRDNIGKTPIEIPSTITEYEIAGNTQNREIAFSLPTTITRVFLPLDLSAS
jgi:hypothetical protein